MARQIRYLGRRSRLEREWLVGGRTRTGVSAPRVTPRRSALMVPWCPPCLGWVHVLRRDCGMVAFLSVGRFVCRL
jgi:hypothetical protein